MTSMLRTGRRAAMLALAAIATSAMAHAQWSYGAPVEITNTGAALSNYQVAVTLNTAALVGAGKMQANGDDIRFVDASCTQLDYWIESGMNSTETKIWVEVPSIAANDITTIYLQYGNASASGVSDPGATFPFFDDFDGAAIDLTKWDVVNGGSVSVSGGVVSMSSSSTIRTSGSYAGPVVFEVNMTAAAGSFAMVGQYNDGTTQGYAIGYDGGGRWGLNQMDFVRLDGGNGLFWYGTPANAIVGVWSFAWPATASQVGRWPGGSHSMSEGTFTLGSVDGFIRSFNSIGPSLSADWARMRAYAAVEPTTSVGAEGVATTSAAVTLNPVSNTATCSGGSVSFTANATGYSAVQWQRSTDGGTTWRTITGATSTTYTIDPTTLAQNGNLFRAVFDPSSCQGPRTTAATLNLHGAPSMSLRFNTDSISYRPGKMRTIVAYLSGIAGQCGPFTTQLVSITANEAIPVTDIGFASVGTSPADLSFNLHATRTGATPRIYTVTYRVTDASGNSTDVSGTVTVPLVGGL